MAETAGLALFPLPIEVPGWTVHLLRSRQLSGLPEVAWFSALVQQAEGEL